MVASRGAGQPRLAAPVASGSRQAGRGFNRRGRGADRGPAAGALAGRSRSSARRGSRRRERPAHAIDVVAAARARRCAVRDAAGRRAQSARRNSRRQRTQAHGSARPDRGDGLRAGQEVHGTGADTRAAIEGSGGYVSRNGPDRHHDCGQRDSDGRAGRGFPGGWRRSALARQRSRALGRDRGPGLTAASSLCGGDARPAARFPAGRHRAVPCPRARHDRGVPGLPDPAPAAGDRRVPACRATHQPEHSLRRHQHQLLDSR